MRLLVVTLLVVLSVVVGAVPASTQPVGPTIIPLRATGAAASSQAAGIGCAVGPNAPVVPAAAQAAGFTTCVANYDFTQTQSFTSNGQTYQWSNLGSWLDCDGATNPLWTFGYGNCAHIYVTTDGGAQILDLQFTTSDFSTNSSTAIQTGGPANSGNLAQAILTIPTGRYVEFVSKTPSATENNACNAGCLYGKIWTWGGNGNSNFVEWDFLQYYYNGVNSDGAGLVANAGATASIDAIGEPHNVSGYNPTVYNTFGVRTATDTSGNMTMCTYFNGSLIPSGGAYPCGSGTYSPIPLGRNFLVLQIGPQYSPNYIATGDLYMQRLTVWACAGWQTGECYNTTTQVTNGGALTGAP